MMRKKTIFSIPIIRELGLVLVFKMLLIYLLWYVFFSNPVKNMDDKLIATKFLGENIMINTSGASK